MQLNVILQADTLDKLKKMIEKNFNISIRIIREELSIYEQYTIRPIERIFIPEIWKYRIICKNKIYYFGKQ